MSDDSGRPPSTANEPVAQRRVLNPFVTRTNAFDTIPDKLKVALMTVFVVPLRLVGLCLCVLIGWVFASISLLGIAEDHRDKPLRGWRCIMRGLHALNARAAFYLSGFVVRVRGTLSPEAPVLVAAPHSSFVDAIVLFCSGLPSIICRSETIELPFLGTMTDYTQPVYVRREDPDSRQNTIREIQRRARSRGHWPQMLLFPEGTCTNRSCLVQFKPGAFYPGVPVQPVLVRYPNRCDTVTWTWEGPSAWVVLWLTLTQVVTFCEIEYLPVYVPSEEEKENPRLFASNVRARMAEALGVPVVDYTFDDCRLMSRACSWGLPCETGLVEATKLMHELGITIDTVEAEMDRFASIARKEDGLIRMSDFAAHLAIPTSVPQLIEVFNLYDSNGDGVVDFREYLVAVTRLVRPINTEETISLAFRRMDVGEKGHVTRRDVTRAMDIVFDMTEQEGSKLFDQVEKQNEYCITFVEFRECLQKHPEYAVFFTAWFENLKQSLQI
ncbi:lysophosphatidylcholine acyltransferase 2-like [Amphibalanus amphitrite]|uniref:lysophosphatidylcholine acyltransferase 2-like n=1 Tax=Amphibalanus amphitrite TaxID=1232801 RepID=UPI001C917104|nr:lysophosphatidylcholine acyltransferase 2-like [Amphibalanus amphitrite]